jgi:hypothetical protein
MLTTIILAFNIFYTIMSVTEIYMIAAKSIKEDYIPTNRKTSVYAKAIITGLIWSIYLNYFYFNTGCE